MNLEKQVIVEDNINPHSSDIAENIDEPLADTVVVEETTPSLCFVCQHQPAATDAFCVNCAYPLKGSVEEKDAFINEWNYKHLDLEDLDKKVKKATNCLYVLAAISFISGIVYYGITPDYENPVAIVIVNTVLAAIYVGLAMWSKKQPVAAIISGISLYVVVIILNMFENPASIFQGIVLKVFLIIYLSKGIQSAFDAQKIKKQLNLA